VRKHSGDTTLTPAQRTEAPCSNLRPGATEADRREMRRGSERPWALFVAAWGAHQRRDKRVHGRLLDTAAVSTVVDATAHGLSVVRALCRFSPVGSTPPLAALSASRAEGRLPLARRDVQRWLTLAIRGGVGSPMPVEVTVRPDPAPVYPRLMSPMPQPGDRHPGFNAEPGS
jgi:hypothetical protein